MLAVDPGCCRLLREASVLCEYIVMWEMWRLYEYLASLIRPSNLS